MMPQTPTTTTTDEVIFEPATKAEIYKKLKKFNEKKVRAEMNEIIAANRKCSLKEAGDQRVLYPTEVKLVLDAFK